jgi:hypothetical protein
MYVAGGQDEDASAGAGPVNERAEVDENVSEGDGRDIKAAPVSPVV